MNGWKILINLIQNKMELKLKRGKWKISKKYRDIISNGETDIAYVYPSTDAWESYAKLIIDAGNTLNKCGLLPSQLLKQRNQMLEALKRFVKFVDNQKLDYESSMILQIKQAVKQATE